MSHRGDDSTSGTDVLAAFIPTAVTAIIYVGIFAAIRQNHRNIYAPRTFLGSVPEKDRTPASSPGGGHWTRDFRNLTDRFVLQHNSLDAFLYLRFLRFIIYICLFGCCLTWPILMPIHALGGGNAKQLDKISFSNIAKNNLLWGHVAVAWVFFGGIIALVATERLRLIGIRQAYYLNDEYAARLSARTVLYMNAPNEACQPENLEQFFGKDAERCWPVKDTSDLDDLIQQRHTSALTLESAEFDLILKGCKLKKQGPAAANGEDGHGAVPRHHRPTKRQPPVIGSKVDSIDTTRQMVVDLTEKVDERRQAPSNVTLEQSAVFVAFSDQGAAHRAYQEVTFQPRYPIQDRYLNVQPKEVLWKNLTMPVSMRMSKASLALVFVIVFTIFFSIPVGVIGTISNVKYLANEVSWLNWLLKLPDWVVGLISGLLPPFLVSWFVSYVPKLFRHIAKLSGEPTTPQAELKTQAWYFSFQVVQVFLITTLSSGTAAVVEQIIKDPSSAPDLLAEGLPKASNFYLTYFILQGTASAASNLLRYDDLLEYLFYEHYWDKTPREKFGTYAQMKGTPWASWMPKFTNLLVIAIAYSCLAPLVLGFAVIGIFMYYLSYRYNLLYVIQTKVDTRGEAYKRALQQVPTGVYIAEICLIGLMGARKAAAQTVLMVVLLVLTAVVNLLLDRMFNPLEIYLGVDKWQAQEVPLLADEDGIDYDDQDALHAASHGRRTGLNVLPGSAPRVISDHVDSVISSAREQVRGWLHDPSAARSEGDIAQLSEEDLEKVFLAPALTSKTPKLWIPKDGAGVSQQEIQTDKAAGITTTDEGAEIDENGKVQWDHRFENVPIFSKPKAI